MNIAEQLPRIEGNTIREAYREKKRENLRISACKDFQLTTGR